MALLAMKNKVLLTKLTFAIVFSTVITTIVAFFLLGTTVNTATLFTSLPNNLLLLILFVVFFYLSWKMSDLISFRFVRMGVTVVSKVGAKGFRVVLFSWQYYK